jgi:hypothetical protein
MSNVAIPEQDILYKIIDYKKYDGFLVEAFPGKLLRN